MKSIWYLTIFIIGITQIYAKEKTNILLFTADDLHSDSLGVYGGLPKNLTPNLDKFASEEEGYGFTKTLVPVRMLKVGSENLVSRSQAKRLLSRFEDFKTVVLDFEGIDVVGQAFADEIFRVFARTARV